LVTSNIEQQSLLQEARDDRNKAMIEAKCYQDMAETLEKRESLRIGCRPKPKWLETSRGTKFSRVVQEEEKSCFRKDFFSL